MEVNGLDCEAVVVSEGCNILEFSKRYVVTNIKGIWEMVEKFQKVVVLFRTSAKEDEFSILVGYKTYWKEGEKFYSSRFLASDF